MSMRGWRRGVDAVACRYEGTEDYTLVKLLYQAGADGDTEDKAGKTLARYLLDNMELLQTMLELAATVENMMGLRSGQRQDQEVFLL